MASTISLDPVRCADVVQSPRWARRVRIDPESGCHLWTGVPNQRGYAQTTIGTDRMVLVHRVALVAVLGRDIMAGMEVDHTCRTRHCVNPKHLREVTHHENTLYASEAVTHCKNGHEFNEKNTHWQYSKATGQRTIRGCRPCKAARSLADYHRKQALIRSIKAART